MLELVVRHRTVLRDLHSHARAYVKLLDGGGRTSAVPTVGTGFADREAKREGGGGVLRSETPVLFRPTAELSDSIADDVLVQLEGLFTNSSALRDARDKFVVAAVRELLGLGCCVKALSCILCVSNDYLYYTPVATNSHPHPVSRLRRAGAHDAPGGRDVLQLVSVEELSLLDCETNEVCGCKATSCDHRPFSPTKLLGDRVHFVAASHRSATLAQRVLIISYVWDTSTCRPSRISLPWLADLLCVDVSQDWTRWAG